MSSAVPTPVETGPAAAAPRKPDPLQAPAVAPLPAQESPHGEPEAPRTAAPRLPPAITLLGWRPEGGRCARACVLVALVAQAAMLALAGPAEGPAGALAAALLAFAAADAHRWGAHVARGGAAHWGEALELPKRLRAPELPRATREMRAGVLAAALTAAAAFELLAGRPAWRAHAGWDAALLALQLPLAALAPALLAAAAALFALEARALATACAGVDLQRTPVPRAAERLLRARALLRRSMGLWEGYVLRQGAAGLCALWLLVVAPRSPVVVGGALALLATAAALLAGCALRLRAMGAVAAQAAALAEALEQLPPDAKLRAKPGFETRLAFLRVLAVAFMGVNTEDDLLRRFL